LCSPEEKGKKGKWRRSPTRGKEKKGEKEGFEFLQLGNCECCDARKRNVNGFARKKGGRSNSYTQRKMLALGEVREKTLRFKRPGVAGKEEGRGGRSKAEPDAAKREKKTTTVKKGGKRDSFLASSEETALPASGRRKKKKKGNYNFAVLIERTRGGTAYTKRQRSSHLTSEWVSSASKKKTCNYLKKAHNAEVASKKGGDRRH